MSGKAVRPTLSIGGYGIPAIPTQSANNMAAWGWLRADGVGVAACGWRGVAACGWQGCHTLLLIHLRRPMQMSASTDADGCVDRCGCLHRPMRMSASTDADVCVDRCEPCREGFLALASGKAECYTALTTLLVLPYRNDQQCIIKKKSGATFMSHRFLCVYKYRLNGNEDGLLLCKDRANPEFSVFRVTITRAKSRYIFFIRCYHESTTISIYF